MKDLSNVTENKLKSKIFEYINNSIGIIDTHEHLRNINEFDYKYGLFDLFLDSNVVVDLQMSGLEIFKYVKREGSLYPMIEPNKEFFELRDQPVKILQKIKKNLNYVLATSYYKSLIKAFKDLYDFKSDKITENNWKELSDKIIENYKNIKNWFPFVIKKKSKIDIIIKDLGNFNKPDKEVQSFILPVHRFDYLMFYHHRKRLYEFLYVRTWDGYDKLFNELDSKHNKGIETFGHYLDMVNKEITDKINNLKILGIKIRPYVRSLNFEYVEENEAKRVFEKNVKDINSYESKKFQDFIMHKIIQRIIDENLVIQIHTGTQGILIEMEWGNPLNLNKILLLYPHGKFDLFHSGYPFSDILIAICKTSKNAYFNMCWNPTFAESACEEILKKVLDAVPNNKILWGGDCKNVEEQYGAVYFVKDIISTVLAEKVKRNKLSFNDALYVAKNILRDNAKELYKI